MISGAVELALALLVTGNDAFDSDDVEPRLTAGAASLAERGLVDSDGQMLSTDLAALVEVVASPAFTIYLRKMVDDADDGLAFHFRDEAIVAQRIEPGGNHTLMPLDSRDVAAVLTAGFFGVGPLEATEDTFLLPTTTVAKLNAASDAEQRSTALTAADIAETHPSFAADYAASTLRGGFLRIDYGHGHPTTRAGATIIGSSERFWLLRPAPEVSVRITHASLDALQTELDLLCALNP